MSVRLNLMKSRALVFFLLVFLPLIGATTRPTSQATIGGWLDDLASSDSVKRDDARISLMSLHRDDLPELKKLVQGIGPLSPAQAGGLHDIVIHVYLSDEPYAGDAQAGFLGLRWSPE